MFFNVTAAGQLCKQTVDLHLGRAISAHQDLSVEISRRLQRASACFGRCKMEIKHRPGVRLRLNIFGCGKLRYSRRWCTSESRGAPKPADYIRLRKVHYSMLRQCLSRRKRKRQGHALSYPRALVNADSESIETTGAQTTDIVRRFRGTHGRRVPAEKGNV